MPHLTQLPVSNSTNGLQSMVPVNARDVHYKFYNTFNEIYVQRKGQKCKLKLYSNMAM